MKNPSIHGMALAVAASSIVTASASAAVITWNLNVVIPADSAGVFINLQEQTFGSSAAIGSGWDLNPNGASGLFFGGSTAGGPWMFVDPATGYDSASTLAVGTVVGPNGAFAATPHGSVMFGNGAGLWKEQAYNFFGFRFLDAQDQVRYGFGMMWVGGSALDRRLVLLGYDDSGAGIAAVPAPGAVALLALLGPATGGRRRRG